MAIDRMLIVGLGSIGQRHLRLARMLLPQADIRVLRHQPCKDVPEFADGCFSQLNEAIAFAPQFAVIATPASFHLPIAIALANIGTHLLVEKPLAAEIEGVEALIACCRSQQVVLLTGYNLRFLPSLQKFRELLNSNTIGHILSVRCEIGQYLPTWRPDSDYRQGVSAHRAMGGGALLELSHELDYLRWIFGEVDWVQASLSKQSALEIDVEDTAHLTLGFQGTDGARGLIGSLNLDFIRHDTTRLCTAIGELGSLRWNGLTGVVEIFDAGADKWRELYRHQHQRDESYLAEWHHMLTCILGQETPLITGADGLQVLRIVEAARRAAATGQKTQVASLSSTPESYI
jgi:predicted dehydrogenase